MSPRIKYTNLQTRITSVCKTNVNFAILMDMSHPTLVKKLKDDGVWTSSEIEKACEILKIPKKDISHYFFTI